MSFVDLLSMLFSIHFLLKFPLIVISRFLDANFDRIFLNLVCISFFHLLKKFLNRNLIDIAETKKKRKKNNKFKINKNKKNKNFIKKYN